MLHTFAQSDRINFSEVESFAIYYGIMATAKKHGIRLESSKGIESAADKFLANQDWSGCTGFRRECVTNRTKLFATRDVEWNGTQKVGLGDVPRKKKATE